MSPLIVNWLRQCQNRGPPRRKHKCKLPRSRHPARKYPHASHQLCSHSLTLSNFITKLSFTSLCVRAAIQTGPPQSHTSMHHPTPTGRPRHHASESTRLELGNPANRDRAPRQAKPDWLIWRAARRQPRRSTAPPAGSCTNPNSPDSPKQKFFRMERQDKGDICALPAYDSSCFCVWKERAAPRWAGPLPHWLKVEKTDGPASSLPL